MFRESLFYELKKLEIQRLVRFLVSVFLCVLFCLVFPGFVSGGGAVCSVWWPGLPGWVTGYRAGGAVWSLSLSLSLSFSLSLSLSLSLSASFSLHFSVGVGGWGGVGWEGGVW